MKNNVSLCLIGIGLLAGCSQSADPSAEFQKQSAEQQAVVVAAAKAIHFDPKPGEVQIVDLPEEPWSVELRLVWERAERHRYSGTRGEESSSILFFGAHVMGEKCSNAMKLPEGMEQESFLPGWLQITVTDADARRTKRYYINKGEITLDKSAANKLSLKLFNEVPAGSPTTMPMGKPAPR